MQNAEKIAYYASRRNDIYSPEPGELPDYALRDDYRRDVWPTVQRISKTSPIPLRLARIVWSHEDPRQGFELWLGCTRLRHYSPQGYVKAFEELETLSQALTVAGVAHRVRADLPNAERRGRVS